MRAGGRGRADRRCGAGRDGRLYVFTDRDAPRGRLAVTDPADAGLRRPGSDLVPRGPRGGARAASRSSTAPELDRPVLLAAWTRHAVSEITVHDLATGERPGAGRRCPAWARSAGCASGPRAGTRPGSATPTTPRRRRCCRYDARDRRRSAWADARPGAVDGARGRAPEQVAVPRPRRHHGADGRHRRPAEAGPRGRGPTILYGYGGFDISLTPAYSPAILAWVEAGGVYAVASLRGGSEEGEEWHRAGHARAQAERLRRLPRGGRDADRRRLDHARTSWPSPAARTAACWSARR